MTRSKAREVAMMMLYSALVGGEDTPEKVLDKMGEKVKIDELDEMFIRELVEGVKAHESELDALIEENAIGWSLDRIARVDLSILRVAIFEMLFSESVPSGAAINEAVELAKVYGGDKSFAFVNGILGTIARAQDA